MPFYLYDLEYLLYILPGLLLAMYAQAKVNSAYDKYSKIKSTANLTGAQVARIILDRNGLHNIRIESINGKLTDHYDPSKKAIFLSEGVYDSCSIAAISVAAHEVGHSIQDAENYGPLKVRSILVPAAQIGSSLSIYLVLLGLVFHSLGFLLKIGVALFCVAVLFQLITLPVEINASSRAEEELEKNILVSGELEGTRSVLHAAALTYLASLLTAIGSLLRLLSLASRRRND